ncbi:MAG: gliding motility-associated C-terminal domain-containing protein, partial [Ginsengibacter sp.]
NFSSLLNPSHLYPVPGSYTVKAIIYDKCFADTTSVTITINDSKSVHVPGSIGDTVLCYGEQLFVNAADPLAKEYKWNDGVNVAGRVISKEGDYTVTIANDCSLDRKTFNVSFKVCQCKFYIPNAFSPNGDGLNDVFKPILDCIPVEYQMKIYDRYGSVVYQTGKSTEGWNGTKKLHDLPAGVYMWIINYHHPGTNDFIKKKGTVTLLR